VYAHLFNTSWECGVVFVCRPCSQCSGPVDRSVGYPTTGLCVWDAAAEAGGYGVIKNNNNSPFPELRN